MIRDRISCIYWVTANKFTDECEIGPRHESGHSAISLLAYHRTARTTVLSRLPTIFMGYGLAIGPVVFFGFRA